MASSPPKTNIDLSDGSGGLEFEEIPSRQKQDVLDALQVQFISITIN